jgi:hypothetical protein
MSEPQSPTFCAQCGRKLSPEDRFCPECGTRVPGNSAATPPQPLTGVPTVVLPPDQPPAGVPTVVLPPDQPPAGVPTVVLPPNQPPAGVPPTVVLPPTQPPVGSSPPQSPPGVPPVIPPVQSVGTPPDPFLPPPPPAYGGLSTHPSPLQIPSTTGMTAQRSNNWLVWGLVGGGGCLLLIFIVTCVAILLSISMFNTVSEDLISTSPTTGSSGAVAPVTDGQVLFRDDFEDPQASNLGESEDRSSRYAYDQGNYVIEVKQSEMLVWALVEGTYRDVVIETSYSVPANSANVAAGLIFHYQDSNNFYLFSVSNDGYYALELLKDDQWVTLIDWTKHNVINAAKNRLRVVLNGDEITLFVNDRQLEKTRDPTFTSGEIGLAVTSFDKAGAIVRYDEITIRKR